MILLKPSYELIDLPEGNEALKRIERAARTCYRSEDRIKDDGSSAKSLVRSLIDRGHEAMLEFCDMTVRFTTDRGVANELVRHRLASFAQESTRYVCSTDKRQLTILDEQSVVEAYESGLSMRRISALSSGRYTEWETYKILRRSGIRRRPLGNTGPVNHNVFESINTAEVAYLLGMLMADGSVNTKNNMVTLTQHQDTIWYLHRMWRELVRPLTPLVQDKNCQSLNVVSSKICSGLIAKGIIPNKSHKFGAEEAEALWSAVPQDLIPDFLRGYMDGDGHIRFFKQTNKGQTDSCRIGWSGPEALLKKIAGWLLETFNYRAVVKKTASQYLFVLDVTQPEVGEELCRVLYKNFRFPYGNPVKTSRAWERIKFEYDAASWGSSEFQVVMPLTKLEAANWSWARSMDNSEDAYTELIVSGIAPQMARSVLPLCLKTEIMVKANLREWRHIFAVRTPHTAHPQMRELMVPLLKEVQERIPIIFDDFTEGETV